MLLIHEEEKKLRNKKLNDIIHYLNRWNMIYNFENQRTQFFERLKNTKWVVHKQ